MLGGLYVTGVPGDRERGGPDRNRRRGGHLYGAGLGNADRRRHVAGALSLGQRILSVGETLDAWFAGARSMLYAIIVLVLAWSLSSVNAELQTAEFLASRPRRRAGCAAHAHRGIRPGGGDRVRHRHELGHDGHPDPACRPRWSGPAPRCRVFPAPITCSTPPCPQCLPARSWATTPRRFRTRTILSSAATSCDHLEHVHTQLPYALTVGGIAVLLGLIPSGFGLPWWICMVAGAACVVAVVWRLGKRRPDDRPPDGRSSRAV